MRFGGGRHGLHDWGGAAQRAGYGHASHGHGYADLAKAQRHVQGIYLMPSFGRYEMVAELVKVLNQPGWAEAATTGPNGRNRA